MASAHRLLTPTVSTISLYPFPVRIPTGSSVQNRPPPIVRREKSCVPLLVGSIPKITLLLLAHISYLFLKIHPQPVDILINFIPINFVSL